jgi:sulfur carrier protein ThiS
MDLPDGTTVGQVIARLDLPVGPRIVFVNGRHAPDSHSLANGDRLAIFPPVAGG